MLVLAVIGYMAAPALAQNCRMDEAQNLYYNMRLNDAIRLLEDCRQADRWVDLDEAQKADALRLLAFSYDARSEPDSSRAAVRALMRENRGYRAAATDPNFFQALVREFRPKWYQKRWVQLGSAVVIGGVLGILLFLRPPSDLPGPPMHPPPPGN